METKHKIAKYAGIVIIATIFCRILGLGREIVISNRFGAGIETDALSEKNKEESIKYFKDTVAILDKSVNKGILPKNTASRQKSSLTKKLNTLIEAEEIKKSMPAAPKKVVEPQEKPVVKKTVKAAKKPVTKKPAVSKKKTETKKTVKAKKKPVVKKTVKAAKKPVTKKTEIKKAKS
ncbi:unnamed protein product [marine sediment metagenome]|uniref:Uncharacterized protein n=1 Tax=marine sediment metagenome TaxID=412755 RepID=X1ID63_9ZZZZ